MPPVPARLPSVYLPHGGGPCFFMDPMPGLPPHAWDSMARYLRGLAAGLPQRPWQILVISAHWETAVPTVGASPRHTLLYDYYGFPEHTYRLQYPAGGSPQLAQRVRDLLRDAGISSVADMQRGLDHGVFIPFMLAFPDADLPIVPLSLQAGLDARSHLAIGRALAPLRDEGVLIVGSGMSYHNLGSFFGADPRDQMAARQFHDWLDQQVAHAAPQQRAQALESWQKAPGALACHPRAEHLLPLMVVAGAGADDPGRLAYRDQVLDKDVCAMHFG